MTPFRHRTLKTRIERISREQSEKLRLTGISGIGLVMVHKSLKARDATNRFR